jgi:hypothetical protein
MRDEATKLFKPKGFSRAEDEDAHREAEVMDEVSVVAHHSMWGGVSLISPHPKEGHSHLLHREAGFPKDMVVNMLAQQGPKHLYHQHLLPKAERMEDSQVQIQQQPFSNVMKRHANWNACYSCARRFFVPREHRWGNHMGKYMGFSICREVTKFEMTVLGVPKLQKTIPRNVELPAALCRSVA